MRISVRWLFLPMTALMTALMATLLAADTLAFQDSGEKPPERFGSVDIEFFENHIRPLLETHCLECHGDDPGNIRGGLRLTSRASILQGGDSGPAVVVGEAAKSLLIQSVRYEDFEMPPRGPLAEDEIATLVQWVERGLPDPRRATPSSGDASAPDVARGRQFWAFQKPGPVAVPEIPGSNWPRTDIDRLILARQLQAGIQPGVDASRVTLLRRAYLALHGLPPTIEQIDRFVDDPQPLPQAFDRVIDELLASPRFGERWGRHWLDVVRFAESSGGGRSLVFPHAWRFRDYVIDAYNSDKPFDELLREQIAGDLLPYQDHDEKIEHLVATGMLALGPTNYEQQDKERLRLEVIDEQVDTIGRAFMGLTLGCARCHDHKFDPIPMTDYYALAGILGATQTLVDGNVSKYVERPLVTEQELRVREQYRKQVETLTQQWTAAESELQRIQGETGVADPARKRVEAGELAGLVMDDQDARRTGKWKTSRHSGLFVNEHYLHDENGDKGKKAVVFEPQLAAGGQYEVRLAYTAGGNRASNVPVTIDHQDGKTTVIVNQSRTPPIDGLFVSLGTYRFEANSRSAITIATTDTDGHVIVDAVQMLPVESNVTSRVPAEADQTDRADHNGLAKAAARSPSRKTVNAAEYARVWQQVQDLDARLRALKERAPGPLSVAMSVQDVPDPQDGHLYVRGSVRRPGPRIPRGFISVCCDQQATLLVGARQSGRLELANWLADADHPLTARVYVNRIWKHLMGRGIVATPDNFGSMGQRPDHPELLDWLAGEFVRQGWSTKQLIRTIMRSHVYRLDTRIQALAQARDPENRLLWRAPRRRVDAEVLRDSMLSVSGQLDLTMGGPTIRRITEYDLGYEFDTVRRSVYVPVFRNSMLDLFEVFDFANPNLVTGQRNASTLPTQALFLMNSPVVMEQARQAANRLLSSPPELTDEQRVELAYRRTLGRPPFPGEMEKTMLHLDSFSDEKLAWSSVFHALFASLDFRYVE